LSWLTFASLGGLSSCAGSDATGSAVRALHSEPRNRWVAAVDLGGSIVKGTLAAIDRLDYPVRRVARNPGRPIDDLLGVISSLQLEAESTNKSLIAVGVAVPGIVDETAGVVRRAVNLGMEEIALRAELEKKLHIPVFVGHDIRCAARAEANVNPEAFGQSTLVTPIGTGIGGAVMMDCELLVAGGYAGEIGHINVGSERICACGLTGCLETVSSTRAISQIYAERSGKAGMDATKIADLSLSSGDVAAAYTWDSAVDSLATALAACSSMLGLDSIIIGGGLSLAGSKLIGPLQDSLYRRLSFHRRPRLSIAKLAADAGCRGAAFGALSRVAENWPD
jgi:glucokinase